MNTKKSLFALGLLNILFIVTYAVYLLVPINFGYDPIGIVQIILLILCLIFLVLLLKNIFTNNNKVKLLEYLPDSLLVLGYLISIWLMGICIFWWFAFRP